MDFSCPTCNVVLEAQRLKEVHLWKCASCKGFAISVPLVRKGLNKDAFKEIWQELFSGKAEPGRPCPGCRKPLSMVEADGKGGAVVIDVCRTCQIFWFDDDEYSDLPRVAPEVEGEKRAESRLLTPEELVFAAFKEDQYRRRSFLFKLLDGRVSKELGLDSIFGGFFDK